MTKEQTAEPAPGDRSLDRLSVTELLARVKRGAVPRHVAIIMDGNGRWARRHNLPRVAGHRRGIDSIRDVVDVCVQLGIGYLTVYAFSQENWRRPKGEIDELMALLELYLRREVKALVEHGIRFVTIGRIERLPRRVVELLREVQQKTAGNQGLCLIAGLSYGGRAEIVDAVAQIVRDAQLGKLDADDIDESLLSNYLYTNGIPDPDLMIRTSGERRISNFLLWQLAYTELYFTKTLWPDFRRKELLTALADYQRRERRFGLTGDQMGRGGV